MQSKSNPDHLPIRLAIIANSVALIAAALAVILTYQGIFMFDSPLGLYRILPGDILIDFIWVWVVAGLIGAIVYVVTPSLTSAYILIHERLSRGAYNYHIQHRETDSGSNGHIGRLIIPALVSLGLSFTVTNMAEIAEAVFVVESFDPLPPGVKEPLLASMPLFFILLLIAAFISIVFAPAWMLEDLGVICEKKASRTGSTADIQGVGNWFLSLLKGFAGISTILAYFFVSLDMVSWFQMLPSYGVEVPIWLFLIPVIVVIISPVIAVAPISVSYLLYAATFTKSKSKLTAKLNAKGIISAVVDVKTSAT